LKFAFTLAFQSEPPAWQTLWPGPFLPFFFPLEHIQIGARPLNFTQEQEPFFSPGLLQVFVMWPVWGLGGFRANEMELEAATSQPAADAA
jgi:hypothetical protein